jgi:pimeloyl-ACP methyl ester carboxylesterase
MVDAVTLAGLAERRDPNSDPRFVDHVEEIVARLSSQPASVVLVGHSYAGLVIGAAAARRPQSVALAVFLDAFIPKTGRSMLDLMRPDFADHWRARAQKESNGRWVPPMLSAKSMGILDAADARWVETKLTPHPMATLSDRLDFDERALASVRKRYVWCSRYGGFRRFFDEAKSLSWETQSIDAGHDAMVTHPETVAQALMP